MHVAITGGTGMIGTALTAALTARGDRVTVLTRRPASHTDLVRWDPVRGVAKVRRLEGLDALVNLTGAPLATRPWTSPRRRILVDSRVAATEAIVGSLARLEAPPRTVVGVGLLGIYGDRGDAWIDDDAPAGDGFLAELGQAWEAAHGLGASELGARVAVLRLGICLSSGGGAFPAMLGPFRHGFGGWLGSGRQFTAWMSLRDIVGALLHLLDTPTAEGAFNGSVPDPVRNRAWCEALGHVLDTQVMTHAPSWALRGALGEMADAVFLNSVRARPRKLLESGFSFSDPEVEPVFCRLVRETGF